MGWSEEVHRNRVKESIATARRERQLKRNGAPVPVSPTSNAGGFLVGAALAVGLVGYKLYEKQLRSIKWKELPLIKQFHSLVTGEGSGFSSTKSQATRPKPRAAAAPAKVSASGKPKPVGKPASSTSSAPTPSAAAAAAALQRAAVATTDSPASYAKPEPSYVPVLADPGKADTEGEEEGEEETTASPGGAAGSGVKSKRKKKKGKK